MSDIKILQVKLIKQGEGLELAFRNNEGIASTDGKECKEAVHPDMVSAVNALCIHLAIHADYLTEKQATDPEQLSPFIVTGYSWNQKETGITLTGVRSTARGKSLVLNIMIPMEGEAAEEYSLQKDFTKKIKLIEKEVHAYLKGDKKLQAGLFPPEDDGKMTTVKVLPPDETGMSGEGKEFTANEYIAEFNNTAELREEGKVTPIKKERAKKEKPATIDDVLEGKLKKVKKNPGKK